MTTLEFNEICNHEIAEKLKNISIEDYLRLCDKQITEENILDAKGWLTIMKRYCKESVENKEKGMIVTYKFAKNCNEGRLYASTESLQQIKKEFRGVLCDGLYYDFDMVNAHPVILNNICKTNDIKFKSETKDTAIKIKYLNEYCEDRNNKIMELCEDDNITKEEAKLLFIKSINTEYKVTKYNQKKIKNKFFIEFDNEIKAIMKQLIKKCPEEYNIIKQKEKDNINGKFISYICRKHESIILNKVNEIFNADILMYDGFMIKCDKISNIEETLQKLNEITKEQGIEWSNKHHDTSLYDEIMELKQITGLEIIEKKLEDVARKLFKIVYDKRLAWNSGNLWYKSPSGWINNSKRIERYIFSELTKHHLYSYHLDKDGKEIITRFCEVKHYKDLITFIINWAKENDKLLDEIQRFCFGKLFFKNGYYDIQKKTFVKSNDFNTIKRIEKEWCSESQVNEEIKLVYDKILNPIFTCEKETDTTRIQLRDNFLYNMSRVLFGYYQDKNWYSMDGLRDGGKGMITELLEKTFEKYICATHGENFLYKQSQSADEAKAKSFLIDFIGSRLVICNEIKVDKNSYFDGNKIKSFCSGGDTQSARKNFQDEQFFKLECGLMFCCNDLPEIKPADAKERQIEYSLCSKFCNEELYEEKKNNVEISFRYYLKDENLKMEISNEKIQMAFVHILIKAFIQGEIKYPSELKKDNETDNNDDFKTFDSFFNFEEPEEKTLLLKDIVDKCRDNNILFQQKKIKQLLMNKGKLFKKTNKGQSCVAISFIEEEKDFL
mgnify:CR=1 FL=1